MLHNSQPQSNSWLSHTIPTSKAKQDGKDNNFESKNKQELVSSKSDSLQGLGCTMKRLHPTPSTEKAKEKDKTNLTINAKGGLFALLQPAPPTAPQAINVHQSSLTSILSSNSCNIIDALSDPFFFFFFFLVLLGDVSNFGNFHPLYVYFNPIFYPHPNLHTPMFPSGFPTFLTLLLIFLLINMSLVFSVFLICAPQPLLPFHVAQFPPMIIPNCPHQLPLSCVPIHVWL